MFIIRLTSELSDTEGEYVEKKKKDFLCPS